MYLGVVFTKREMSEDKRALVLLFQTMNYHSINTELLEVDFLIRLFLSSISFLSHYIYYMAGVRNLTIALDKISRDISSAL